MLQVTRPPGKDYIDGKIFKFKKSVNFNINYKEKWPFVFR